MALWTRAGQTLSDNWLMTWRNLMYYARNPYWLSMALVQPIIFTVLFVYVFGGAIFPDGGYADYLLPGIIVQTVIFSSLGTSINIAEDMQKGVMDRFRSLPIGRGTVLSARTLSDVVRNLVSALLMVGVGLLIGYRFHGGPADALLALGLTLLVGYAFSWIAATIGLMVKGTQTAEMAGFTWAFPLVFASTIFVRVETLPGWLEGFVKVNPVSLAADAVRGWSYGEGAGHAGWQAALWCIDISAVFAAIASWRFRRLS